MAEARCTGLSRSARLPAKKLVAEKAHPPFGDRDCSTCHLPPDEKRALARLKKDLLTECDSCHDFAKRAAAVKVPHAPVKAGRCFECHTPHASSRDHLLVEGGGSLCWGCHAKTQKVLEQPFVHSPVKLGECTKCHEIHGGALKKLLVRAGADLCFGCHAPQKALLASSWVHQPFGDGDCASCHDPHGAANRAQTLEPLPALCTNCHDLSEPKAKAKHARVPPSTACTACHDPHAAKAKLKS